VGESGAGRRATLADVYGVASRTRMSSRPPQDLKARYLCTFYADPSMTLNDDACDVWRHANIALSIDTDPGTLGVYRAMLAGQATGRVGT